jgi:hypothetical protein
LFRANRYCKRHSSHRRSAGAEVGGLGVNAYSSRSRVFYISRDGSIMDSVVSVLLVERPAIGIAAFIEKHKAKFAGK